MFRSISALAVLAVMLAACAAGTPADFSDRRTPHWGKGAVVTGGTVRGGGGD